MTPNTNTNTTIDTNTNTNTKVIPTTMGYTVRTQSYSYTEWVYIEVLDEEVRH